VFFLYARLGCLPFLCRASSGSVLQVTPLEPVSKKGRPLNFPQKSPVHLFCSSPFDEAADVSADTWWKIIRFDW